MATNERLRAAINHAGITPEQLAQAVRVDRKTVDRWIGVGRTPHRTTRLLVARALGQDDAYLWPDTSSDSRTITASESEHVRTYLNRLQILPAQWAELIEGATESIDILAYAATFLHDQVDGCADAFRDALARGVQIRMLLGDPTCEAVLLRGHDEGLGDGLADRCNLSRKAFWPLVGTPGFEMRLHCTTLYASMFRFDRELFANHHLYGFPAAQSPVFHLREVLGGQLVAHHLRSFERVWEGAHAITTEASSSEIDG